MTTVFIITPVAKYPTTPINQCHQHTNAGNAERIEEKKRMIQRILERRKEQEKKRRIRCDHLPFASRAGVQLLGSSRHRIGPSLPMACSFEGNEKQYLIASSSAQWHNQFDSSCTSMLATPWCEQNFNGILAPMPLLAVNSSTKQVDGYRSCRTAAYYQDFELIRCTFLATPIPSNAIWLASPI